MKTSLRLATVAMLLLAAASAQAGTRKQDISKLESFTAADALKGQAYVKAAMTTPMLDMLRKADVRHPEVMLEYGLALDLGRPSVSQQLSAGEKDKLKRGFRAMLDLYLTSSDKFDISFNEDAMLDQAEFWTYLAKHVGRPKDRVQQMDAAPGNAQLGDQMAFFTPDDPNQDKEFNLNNDLVLAPNVVNASITCVESAFGFAKFRKAQTVDISATHLTPEQFTAVQERAVQGYRLAYSTGVLGCGSKNYFEQVATFASGNLGTLGAMKDNPAAVLAPLGDDAPMATTTTP